MHVVIAGCGRVGSGLARDIAHEGFEVAVIDENPDAVLPPGRKLPGGHDPWSGARVERPPQGAASRTPTAFVACTDGDNTNLVIAQIAQKKYGIGCVVARVFDPLRAEMFAQAGIRIVCPTRELRATLFEAVRACRVPPKEG